MEFMECVKGRRSVRKFTSQPIDRAAFERVVAAASLSPSWKNTQTVRYILIEDAALKNEIAENCVMDFAPNKATIQNATALVLVTTVKGRSGFERDGSFSTSQGTHWESFDAGIATQTFCLAAHNEGFGTVVLGIYDEAKTIAVAGIPEGQGLAAMVPIGYPSDVPDMPKRKGVEDLVTYK